MIKIIFITLLIQKKKIDIHIYSKNKTAKFIWKKKYFLVMTLCKSFSLFFTCSTQHYFANWTVLITRKLMSILVDRIFSAVHKKKKKYNVNVKEILRECTWVEKIFLQIIKFISVTQLNKYISQCSCQLKDNYKITDIFIIEKNFFNIYYSTFSFICKYSCKKTKGIWYYFTFKPMLCLKRRMKLYLNARMKLYLNDRMKLYLNDRMV